jgi:hypothetical protein
MSISEKQLIANQENAKKGGVKTEEGKKIIRHNALKHGLLAKEIVITQGEGAERQDEFDSLLADLHEQFNPEGPVEAMLVEKMAVSWWRLRRVYRYEVGLITEEINNAAGILISQSLSPQGINTLYRGDPRINEGLEQAKKELAAMKSELAQLCQMCKEDKNLETIYGRKELWTPLFREHEKLFKSTVNIPSPEKIRTTLNTAGLSDDTIWQAILEQKEVAQSIPENEINRLEVIIANGERLAQLRIMKSGVPAQKDLDRSLRYESTIERQFYKAMDQLERMQRRRAGEHVPPPMKLSVDVNTADGS